MKRLLENLPLPHFAVAAAACVGLSLLLPAGTAAAAVQDYPARPMRFVVGFPAGGLADLLARSLAQKLTEAWGRQAIVDNRAGASGAIAMQIVASAPRDGYTLLLGSSTQFAISPGLRSVPYDPIRDYTPVIKVASNPVILTVHPSFAAKSLPELIQLAKAKSADPMSYGSSGYGAAPHIAAELLKKVAGINLTHVPYKGGSDAVAALLGGHIPMNFGAPSTALGHVKAGRLRALGVTGAQPLTAAPDVPTFAQAGLRGFNVDQWYGVFTAAGVPRPIVGKVNQELARALASPQFREQFITQGVELTSSSPEEFAAFVSAELALWKRVLKELGIRDAP